MRDSNRIDLMCNTLAEVWKLTPDLRLGQLLGNACQVKSGIFYLEDEDVLSAILAWKNKVETKQDTFTSM